MSTQSQRRPEESLPGPSERTREPEGSGVRRSFLIAQAVFVLFIAIALIPEPTSPLSPVGPEVEIAIVAGLWILADLVLAVRALQLRSDRARR